MPRRAYHSGPVHWCLTVVWAGRTFRWATSPLAIETEDGEVLFFEDGLDPIDYEDSLQGLGVASARSIPIDIFFPAEVDVAEWVSLGHDLSSATGEVSLWSEGTVWEERRVVLAGPVREPEYGEIDEPVSFSVDDALQLDRSFIPGRQFVVTLEAWPLAPEDSIGLVYPTVFGRPGVLFDTNATCAGSPAPVVYVAAGLATKVVVAGHRVEATSAIMFNEDGQTYTFNLDTETDGLGQVVTTIDLSVVSTGTFAREGSEFWVSWFYGDALIDAAGEPAQSVGAVLEFLLGQSSVSLDRIEWVALGGPRIEGFIDEQVSPWEWIVDNVLTILPLSVLPGPDGYYPVLWRLGAPPREAVATISPDDDPTIEREGRLTYAKLAEVTNAFTFDYAIDPQAGDARRSLIVSGDADTDAGEVGGYYCEQSQARFGTREEELDSDIVWRAETASYCVARRAERSALPSREVVYTVPYTLGWLRLGDVVLVNDSAVSLDEAVALIVGIRWVSEDALSVRLLIPARPELRG